MAYQALYRKYRPRSFEDFIDQDNIKQVLVNSIANNSISHAYLFSGPRGIGKTSMAKIFAKAINCLNFNENHDVCDECENCIECNNNSVDIIEIDAASNNGVDQIRDLKNKITIVPSKLKYKVYIVDEVHMLTNSAFNALLKTLEEPPSHVVFILATTEFYEVPETIVSRCQCFSFSRITMESLAKRLRYIADKEKIQIDDDAINEIANYSNGGLRDAIGMLDKLHSFTENKITQEVFKSINGMISIEDIKNFYEYIFNNNVDKIIELINKIDEQGYDFKYFVEKEMLYVRDKIVNFYIKKEDVLGNINDNMDFVSTLNDILTKLKETVNPMVVVQINVLKYLNNISREIKEKDSEIISQEIKVSPKIISQEIKSDFNNENVTKKNDEINNVQNNAEIKKNCKNGQISGKISVNLQIKRVRINNSFATANIHYKQEMMKLWEGLSKYFMDEKYSKVSQLLSDTSPMVVGSDYAILTTSSEGLIENLYLNLSNVEKFLEHIYRNLHIVVITNSEFEELKTKYIEDKKNNIVYKIQEECDKLIDEENLISQAIDVFGKDLVEIE